MQLSGILYDAGGPLSSVTITFKATQTTQNGVILSASRGFTTNEDGTYSISLEPGYYNVFWSERGRRVRLGTVTADDFTETSLPAALQAEPMPVDSSAVEDAILEALTQMQADLDASTAAREGAETARDAAIVNADAYADTASGLAGTTDGEQFQVVQGYEIIRYLNNGGSAVERARYPAASVIPPLNVAEPPHRTQWANRFQDSESGNGLTATAYTDADVVTDSDLGKTLALTGQGFIGPRYTQRLDSGKIYRVRWVLKRSAVPTDPAANPVYLRCRGMHEAFNTVPGPGASITAEAIEIADTTPVYREYTFSWDHPYADFLMDGDAVQFRVGVLTGSGDDGTTLVSIIDIADVTDRYEFAGAPDGYVTPPNAARATASRAVPPRYFDQGDAQGSTVLSRIAAIEAELRGLRKTRTAIYADPAATGANDGASWADAYTSLKVALEAAAPGDVVYSNAPESNPFPATTADIADGVTWCSDAGPDGETWVSGATYASWTDDGSGVFSVAEASEPVGVAYDFKRDDTTGTATGIDLTRPEFAMALDHWGVDPADCVAWYGFLEQEATATSTPAEGKWSYTGGRLYINPPGTPTLSQVNDLATFGRASSAGVFLSNASGDFLEDFHHYGRLITFFTLNNNGNAYGYGVRSSVAQGCVIEDVLCITSGNHAVGLSGDCGRRNTMRRCIATAGSESGNPYVFRTSLGIPDADYLGDELVAIVHPYLKHDGSPLPANPESIVGNIAYSHGAGGTFYLGGILWSRLLQINPMGLVAAKFGFTLDPTARGRFVSGGDQPPIDPDNAATLTIRCADSLHLGPAGGPSPNVRYINTEFDCLGGTQGNFSFSTVGGPWYLHLERCRWTGVVSGALFAGLITGAGRVTMLQSEMTLQGTNNEAWVRIGDPVDGTLFRLHGTTFRAPDAAKGFIKTQNANATEWRTNQIVASLGGNVFSKRCSPVISDAATFNEQDWVEGADPDNADVLGV